MEIRIDERLVDVFNEVIEKDKKYFNGETNLEKVVNTQLADFFYSIDVENNRFLSTEAKEKLLDFFIGNIENDEVRQGMANLVEAILKNLANK